MSEVWDSAEGAPPAAAHNSAAANNLRINLSPILFSGCFLKRDLCDIDPAAAETVLAILQIIAP
ncbi:MAG: hypothetical protein J0H88_23395, partial [Sphingomonadales bacterium]|nr:hypothetical protein [Sphingomonadales bacterium]